MIRMLFGAMCLLRSSPPSPLRMLLFAGDWAAGKPGVPVDPSFCSSFNGEEEGFLQEVLILPGSSTSWLVGAFLLLVGETGAKATGCPFPHLDTPSTCFSHARLEHVLFLPDALLPFGRCGAWRFLARVLVIGMLHSPDGIN